MTAMKGETTDVTPSPKPRSKPDHDEDVVEATDHAQERATVVAGKDSDDGDDPPKATWWGFSPRRMRIAIVALLVAAVLAVAVLKWIEASRLADQQEARDAVATRAGEFGIALLSYQHGDLTEARDRVLSLATGSFAETYAAAFSAGLKQTIDKVKATASADVRDVFVADVGETMANAIVTLDSTVQSEAGTREVTGLYLQVELVREGDDWKVSNVKSVAGGAGLAPGADGKGGK